MNYRPALYGLACALIGLMIGALIIAAVDRL